MEMWRDWGMLRDKSSRGGGSSDMVRARHRGGRVWSCMAGVCMLRRGWMSGSRAEGISRGDRERLERRLCRGCGTCRLGMTVML